MISRTGREQQIVRRRIDRLVEAWNAFRQVIDCEEKEAVEEATDMGITEHIMLSHYIICQSRRQYDTQLENLNEKHLSVAEV